MFCNIIHTFLLKIGKSNEVFIDKSNFTVYILGEYPEFSIYQLINIKCALVEKYKVNK